MTYTTIDTSAQTGDPVELYTFARGSKTWHYTPDTSNYTDTTVSPNVVYLSAAGGLDHDDIESSDDAVRNDIEITVSREFEVAELFRVASPTDVISVTLREVHRGDTDFVVRWIGRVIGVAWTGAKAKLTCQSIERSGDEMGLKLKCQKHCEAILFGPGCNLDPLDWDHATTVSSISGLDLVVGSVNGALPYAGGEITFEDADGNIDRRMIEFQSGSTLTLVRPFVGVIATDAVTLYPGCAHDITTCETVYSNAVNYRGRPHLSTKNPMNGEGIF